MIAPPNAPRRAIQVLRATSAKDCVTLDYKGLSLRRKRLTAHAG